MRSYALFLALAALARAATIPTPETQKKLPIQEDALDNVSLDNNESEQELVDAANAVKDIENNLRNSVPENVPVKVIEEQPVIKAVALKEDSNDYVPDNDESTNIKRVEIDLNNPGPPQRQEHDSQKPITYSADRERAVAAIRQSIEETQRTFNRGIQDVTQRFRNFFANNEELGEISKTIQNLKKEFDGELVKLNSNVRSYLKPGNVEVTEGEDESETSPETKEAENRLKLLETKFNSGIDMLSEGVELLSILKEEDEQNLKMSGKAEGVNPTDTGSGTSPTNPASGSGTTPDQGSNVVSGWLQNFQNVVNGAMVSVQNFFSPGQTQNQNPSDNATSGGFNPINFFQGLNIPNVFQINQSQNQQQQQQQGTAPAGAQADDASATDRPNILQQIQTTWQNIVSPPAQAPANQQQQQNQNPISQFFNGVNQGITNLFQGRPQQTGQQSNTASGQQAVQPVATPEGTNSVPVATQAQPVTPAKESDAVAAPAQSNPVQTPPASPAAPSGPIQQIVQNSPIVKGITNAVQRIQGLSNPSKPRDSAEVQEVDSKGHGGHGGSSGDIISSRVECMKAAPAPVAEQPQITAEKQDDSNPADLNKTE